MRKADLDPLYAVASDPGLWDQHPAERYKREVFEAFFNESMASGGALVFEDLASGEIIGSSRYLVFTDFPDTVEIGWTFLARKYWGGAWNRLVKHLMMSYAFEHKKHVLLYIHRMNHRSYQAAEKIGGRRIPETEHPAWPPTHADNLIYLFTGPPDPPKTKELG